MGTLAKPDQREGGAEASRTDPQRLATVRKLGLLDSPYTEQAVDMGIEEIADLLAALAEQGLRWIPGSNGECGTLLHGPAEPPDRHVVFDAFQMCWQRDDDRAVLGPGDPCERWFGPCDRRATWQALQRDLGPCTPDGGIAPTTPARVEPVEPVREWGVRWPGGVIEGPLADETAARAAAKLGGGQVATRLGLGVWAVTS